MPDDAFPVLDPRQLRRIESTHRGFLYQHLFGAASLLLAPGNGVEAVLVERDEDVELQLADERVYCQVKTRAAHLQPHDIAEALLRFAELRNAHATSRAGISAGFWIITNASLSDSLQRQYEQETWPADVRISYPGSGEELPPYLPPPWASVAEAIAWCSDLAKKLPFSKLDGETLVWKLAAMVLLACSGSEPYSNHRFSVEELPALFELILIQFQQFPPPPKPYRELEDEPAFSSTDRVRLITGLSGSGKTSWASEAASHSGDRVAYFDIAEVPSEGLAAALARELAARFAVGGSPLATVMAPGLAGMGAIKALDLVLAERPGAHLVVVDNAHRAHPDTLCDMVRAGTSLRWLFLSHPVHETKTLAALLGVTTEPITAFTLESIAGEFADREMPIDAPLANRIRSITGGLPLFVRQAGSLASSHYGANPARMCDELEVGTHTTTTLQEQLLSQTLQSLPPLARQSAALIALSEVVLSTDECRSLLTSVLSITVAVASSTLRALELAGVVGTAASTVSMHDSFRLAAAAGQTDLPDDALAKARRMLMSQMSSSLKKEGRVERMAFFLRLLHQLGETAALVDLATGHEEMFAELGFVPLVRPLLEAIVSDDKAPSKDRFFALDSLVFWSLQANDETLSTKQLSELEALSRQRGSADPFQLKALAVKQILLAGLTKSASHARKTFRRATTDFADDPIFLRILKYDFAVAMFKIGNYEGAEILATEIIAEYYAVLGLKFEDVALANPGEISELLDWDNVSTADNVKRLADALELRAMSANKRGRHYPLSRMHAHKFYMMISAFTSAIRVGQDVVDEMMNMNDAEGALSFMDGFVLPVVIHSRLFNHLVPVRAHRAVVLAYLGRTTEAQAEMDKLGAFHLSHHQRKELTAQRQIIDKLAGQQLVSSGKSSSKQK